jgi:hypothetical protein
MAASGASYVEKEAENTPRLPGDYSCKAVKISAIIGSIAEVALVVIGKIIAGRESHEIFDYVLPEKHLAIGF